MQRLRELDLGVGEFKLFDVSFWAGSHSEFVYLVDDFWAWSWTNILWLVKRRRISTCLLHFLMFHDLEEFEEHGLKILKNSESKALNWELKGLDLLPVKYFLDSLFLPFAFFSSVLDIEYFCESSKCFLLY